MSYFLESVYLFELFLNEADWVNLFAGVDEIFDYFLNLQLELGRLPFQITLTLVDSYFFGYGHSEGVGRVVRHLLPVFLDDGVGRVVKATAVCGVGADVTAI